MIDSQKTIETLKRYNKWRRGAKRIETPSPTLIGIAIDDAIKCIEQRDILAEALRKCRKYMNGEIDSLPFSVIDDALATMKGGQDE